MKKVRIPSVNFGMSEKERDLWNILGMVIYKIALDIAYLWFICGIYGYYKNFKIDIVCIKFLESWLLYFGLIVTTPRKKQTITSCYLVMQLCIMIAPMLSMYGLGNRSRNFIYIVSATHLLQCFLDKYIKGSSEMIIKKGKKISWIMVIILICIAFLLTFSMKGIPGTAALDFSNVYEIRSENVMKFPLNYLLPCLFSVVIPIILVYSLEYRKYWLLFLLGVITLYFYLTYAHKSWFFSFFMIIIVYLFIKRDLFIAGISWGMPIMVSGLLLGLFFSEKFLIPCSLFIRRVLFLPADIKFEYYSFFVSRDKLHFSEGLVGKIFGMKPLYNKAITYIIGDYMKQEGSSCNTGYLADGYANLGITGVFLTGILLLIVLKLFDAVSQGDMFYLNFVILVYSLYGLNDGALLTKMLTGGLGVALILLYFQYQGKGKVDNKKICMESHY